MTTGSISALIVILIISGFTFWLLAKPYSSFIPNVEFSNWRKIWLILVITAFISPNFWIFTIAVSIVLIVFGPNQPKQRVIYYFLLLCALPNVASFIPGIGGIRNLFEISYPRLLTIILLIPLLLKTKQLIPSTLRLFRLPTDWPVVLYILLLVILSLRDSTLTDAMRAVVTLSLDIFIPYYIISRYIDSLEQFNRASAALFITITVIAFISIIEAVKDWHLYFDFMYALTGHAMGYGSRAGTLRAAAMFSSPITLGYVLIFGFGILLYLRPLLKQKMLFYILALIYIVALLATVSRGPWVGFAVFLVMYILTGKEIGKNILIGLISVIMIFPLISLTPFWDQFIDLLPFIGTVDADNVTYRQQLFEKAWIVIQKNLFLGSTTYLETPEMESMRNPQGIIDLVNSYVQIALASGVVGLGLFLLIFVGLLIRTYITIKRLPHNETDLIRLGRVLFAILGAILVVIGTASSIGFVPIFYWLFAGFIAAYINLAKNVISKTEPVQKLTSIK